MYLLSKHYLAHLTEEYFFYKLRNFFMNLTKEYVGPTLFGAGWILLV